MTSPKAPAFQVSLSDIRACPDLRLDVQHYRGDGSCYHGPDKAGNIDRAL